MKITQLYQQLEKDFITPKMSDEWAQHMDSVADFLCDNFKKRSMGLVCDFANKINKVYTAVFPSKKVMQKILIGGTCDAMLFVHHPSIWDIRKAPEVFQQMDRDLLRQFKNKRISIYNLHVPLDNFGDYSTSVSLAKVLGIKPEKAFAPYFGSLYGVFGKTNLATVYEVKEKFEFAVGHGVSLYKYGDDEIKNGVVALITGGGNEVEMLEKITKEGVNVFVTGVALKNDFSKKAHEFAEKHKINILGGTHYSTEKFACMAMVDYFKKLGLPAEFVEDEPVMEDI
ncbi:Nif3-like dinuclear metal center hexameric protein [Candidatus Shapirobacteria bacterium]|nr:Nif3-like dinuclear metal center hexameric protein [Candidatus Shapirobacteria bacterium]